MTVHNSLVSSAAAAADFRPTAAEVDACPGRYTSFPSAAETTGYHRLAADVETTGLILPPSSSDAFSGAADKTTGYFPLSPSSSDAGFASV